MTHEEQARFVEDLVGAVAASLIDDIASGKVPEAWDGKELRQLLADRFSRQVYSLPLRQRREYNNTVLVNDL